MSRNTWKEYFTFSKKERIAVLILLILIVAFVILPFLYPTQPKSITIDNNLQQELEQLNQPSPENNNLGGNERNPSPYDPSVSVTKAEVQLFRFDPNTLDESGWKKLGIKDRIIQTIIHYREKGGLFRKPEDIKKIYGLSNSEAEKLIPYIHINQANNSLNTNSDDRYSSSDKKEKYTRKYNSIEINSATSEEWKALPGIGDVLSNRIVKFRASLGGFSSIDQVAQTYGLSDSTFQIIKPYLKLSR
jgi:DNA uptake protein ComE-like DNA-binding protein